MRAYKVSVDDVYNKSDAGTEELAAKGNFPKSENEEIEPSNKKEYPDYVDNLYKWKWQDKEKLKYYDKRKVLGGKVSLLTGKASLVRHTRFGFDVATGVFKGGYNLGKDTVTGAANIVMHPIETTTSLFNAVLHPVDTTKMLADAISESYERDVINGDTVSQASWITYAIGRSEEHTSELQSRGQLVCRLLRE